MKNFNVGIVGLGNTGLAHLNAWCAVDRAHVVAVCDTAPDAQGNAAKLGIPTFTSLREMLEQTPVEILSICTPPALHLPMAVRAMERGVHVLCETPLTVNYRSTDKLLRCAASSGALLQMASQFRHLAEIRAARRLLREGAIGDVLSFHMEFSSSVDMAACWNSNPIASGGGVIIDSGTQAFDLVNFLFGEIRRVHATRLKPIQKIAVEDQALLLISTDNGVIGEALLSWSMPSSSDSYLTIRGTRGSIAIGWNGSFLQLWGQEPETIANGYDPVQMVTEFRNIAVGVSEPWMTGEELLNIQAAIDCCYRSMALGAWVDVQPKLCPAIAA